MHFLYPDGYYLRLTSTLMLSWNICPPGAGGPIGITSSPRAVPINTWTHVAGTYDAATGAMIMYLDPAGTPDPTTGTAPVPPGNGTSILHLGADYGANQFNGEIDEARVYNRVLTQAEIQILRTGQAPPTGLLATPGPGQVALTWTPEAGSTATNVYRAAAAAGPYTLLASVAGSTYTTLTPNTYFYQVTAVSVMESCPTAAVSATPLPTAPRTTNHPNGNQGINDQCGCGTVATPASPGLLALAGLVLLSLLRLRR